MSALDNLITDRTDLEVYEANQLNGITYANMTVAQKAVYDAGRGVYRHTDANRVGEACAEIYAIAQSYSYDIPGYVPLRTDYTAQTRPTPAEMTQYLATVNAIKMAFSASQALPQTMRFITYDDANNIEKLLAEVNDIMERMLSVFVRSGVYHSNAVIYAKETTVRYRQVEYLISTKGITITGTKLNRESEIRARVYRPSSAVGQYIYQADSGSSLTTNFTAYTSNGNSTANWRFGNTTASIAVPMGAWHETKQNKSGVWIDDSKVASYSAVSAFTSTNSLTIHGTAASANMRIAWLERYENGVFVARYLPLHDLVDDVYGWGDTSDGSFYTNPEATITAGGEI